MPATVVMPVTWSPKPPRMAGGASPGGAKVSGHAGASPERADVVAGPIGVGPLEAVAGDARVDEPRVAASSAFGPRPEPLDRVGPQVGEEHVGGGDQPAHRARAVVGPEIEHDGALAPVVEVERRRLGLAVRRRSG